MSATIKQTFSSLVCAAALGIALSPGAHAADERTSSPIDLAKVRATAGAPTPAARLPSAHGEMAFVFSNLTIAVHPGWDACPKGWATINKETYLAKLPKAEQIRLLKPENEMELTDKWKAELSAWDQNVCSNYNEFPDRALQTQVEGKVAFGLDLDGDTAGDGTKDPYVCSHQTFESPLGEKGIDNQMYRALGCTRTYRGPDGADGEVVPAYKGQVATGQFTVVVILRGVDSLKNDDNVDVILASSDEQPIADTNQNVISGVSYHVSETAKWRNELHGRIVDGVLTTNSKDILLERTAGGGMGREIEWDIQRAKLRVAFRPDGSLEGLIGGYEPLISPLRSQIGGGRGTAHTAGSDCAGKWNTLVALADGARDPQTGKCSRASNAYMITAVPAFVFDRPPQAAKTAAAE